MASKGKKRQKEIAGRLLLLRERLYGNASEMARSVKLTPQRWYNYETGRRALDADTAAVVVAEHGVDFNWLYGGTLDSLKPKVRQLIQQGNVKASKTIGAVEPKSKPKRKRATRSRKPPLDDNGADPHR